MNTVRISNDIHSDVQRVGNKINKQDSSFADTIKNTIRRVNDMHVQADKSAEQLMQGKMGIHEAMLDLQKADISLRILLQIRNKAMEAYKEIMHMQF
jgi:flagellar hook-basal body complex protein FliE